MKKHSNKILSVILSLSLIYQPCTAAGNNYSKIKNNISSLSNKKMSTKDKIAYYGLAAGSLMMLTSAILSLQPKYRTKEELDELGINNGLYNVGNSCYMNAMLQQLYSIDAFREWIINFSYNQHVSDIDEQTLNKIEAMKSIFEYMSGEKETNLKPLMSALGHIGRQEDSFLDCIQSKWSNIFDLFKQEKFEQYSAGYPDDDYLYNSRQLYINSSCKISELLKSNKKYDSVEIKKEFESSEEWLSKFKELWYDNELELDYEKEFNTFCNQKNLVEKAETRKSLFPINGQFMITLSRAGYDSLNRLIRVTTSVEPNELLTNKDINEPGKDKNYKLTGVIIHKGTLYYGHYYSYKFNAKDKEWYEYNDSRVTQVNYDDIRDNIYTNAVAFTYTDVDKLK